MGTIKITPRFEDEAKFLEETADYVRSLDLPEIAEAGLYEYLIEMSKTDIRALRSQLIRLIAHLLKFRYQPQAAYRSWNTTCRLARDEIEAILSESPSLRPRFEVVFNNKSVYESAKQWAEDETGIAMPEENPFTIDQITNRKFLG